MEGAVVAMIIWWLDL